MVWKANVKGNIETIERLGSVEIKKTPTDFPDLNRLKESSEFNFLHTTVKDKVLSILRQDKLARKNDFWLCILYWIKAGQIKLLIPLEEFSKINKPESISRCRRELVREAKEGKEELSFLLNDNKTLDRRDNLKVLNKEYFKNGVNKNY